MKNQKKIPNIMTWLEEQIHQNMKLIDQEGNTKEHLATLDLLVSIRKKYHDGNDPLGEKIRVMEEFISFIKERYSSKDFSQTIFLIEQFLYKQVS